MSVPRKLTQSFPNALVFLMYGLEWRVVYPGSFVLGDEVDEAWPVPPDYYSHPHNKAFNQHGGASRHVWGGHYWALCKLISSGSFANHVIMELDANIRKTGFIFLPLSLQYNRPICIIRL